MSFKSWKKGMSAVSPLSDLKVRGWSPRGMTQTEIQGLSINLQRYYSAPLQNGMMPMNSEMRCNMFSVQEMDINRLWKFPRGEAVLLCSFSHPFKSPQAWVRIQIVFNSNINKKSLYIIWNRYIWAGMQHSGVCAHEFTVPFEQVVRSGFAQSLAQYTWDKAMCHTICFLPTEGNRWK